MGGDHPRKLLSGDDFKEWRLEIEMWSEGTNVKPEKQGPVVACCVQDSKAKDKVLRLDKTKLKTSGGLKVVLDALAEHYSLDATQAMFMGIENLEQSCSCMLRAR